MDRLKQLLRYILLFAYSKSGFKDLKEWLSPVIQNDNIPGLYTAGDKVIEDAWIIGHLPSSAKEILDVGAGDNSPISAIAASLGHRVTAIDLNPLQWEWPGVEFIQGNFIDITFSSRTFDSIIVCSSIEHFGLEGRYNSPEDSLLDIKAMQKIRTLLKHDGTVILTIPVGIDAVILPLHRIYGVERLPQLFDGYEILEEKYYYKYNRIIWREVNEEKAVSLRGSAALYALGLFVLTLNKTNQRRNIN